MIKNQRKLTNTSYENSAPHTYSMNTVHMNSIIGLENDKKSKKIIIIPNRNKNINKTFTYYYIKEDIANR